MSENNFTFHLSSLRSCVIKILLAILVSFIACWFFKVELWDIFKRPVLDYLNQTEGSLIFISPVEKFFSYIRFCLFSAVIVASPYCFFEVWKFLSPGLYKKEKRIFLVFAVLSWSLFILGSLFCFLFISPYIFKFLIYFGDPAELAFLSMKEYLSFFISLILVFAIAFQLPLILSFLGFMRVISSKTLKKHRGNSLVSLAVLSMLLTPPDIFSMIGILVPIYLLYEASILILQLMEKRN